jgi:flagellar biosynthesis/type III secretory pathway M-ring protein FliF/YscJ
MAVSKERTPQPEDDQPKGYQPSFGRKLFMFGLCIVGLIIVWTYYFRVLKP